ncbi:MAG: amidase, partial [Saprospiraceae bacterium]|nr:amidase [Saprospiraceae bacterium]
MRYGITKNGWLALLLISAFVLGAFTSGELLQKITRQDVKGAANIMGLEMTNPEIDSLLPNLEEFREAYTKNREKELDNGLVPSLTFNPVPDNYIAALGKRSRASFKNPGKSILPEDKDKLAWYSIQELASLIKNKEITSVELTKVFINRLKKYDEQLNCVVTLTEDLAMEQAKKADAEIAKGNYKGLLHGIPYGIKDLFATSMHKTTWGAAPFKDQKLDFDATVVKKLDEAGAVMVAKLSLGALAMGDKWFDGMTRNPWK